MACLLGQEGVLHVQQGLLSLVGLPLVLELLVGHLFQVVVLLCLLELPEPPYPLVFHQELTVLALLQQE